MKEFKFYSPEIRIKVTTDLPSNNRTFNFLFYPVIILFYLILAAFSFFTFSIDYFCKAVFLPIE